MQQTEEHVRRLGATHNIRVEVCHLEGGDALWMAKRRHGGGGAGGGDGNGNGDGDGDGNYVLDLVIERKRLDDLISSIRDDRYRQQKFFLKRSGIRQLAYLAGRRRGLNPVSGAPP